MSKAIHVRYLHWTNHKPARVTAKAKDFKAYTIGVDDLQHRAKTEDLDTAVEFLVEWYARMIWNDDYKFIVGTLPDQSWCGVMVPGSKH